MKYVQNGQKRLEMYGFSVIFRSEKYTRKVGYMPEGVNPSGILRKQIKNLNQLLILTMMGVLLQAPEATHFISPVTPV